MLCDLLQSLEENKKRHQQEKVVVVTGSSSGIGFETSYCFQERGFILMQL